MSDFSEFTEVAGNPAAQDAIARLLAETNESGEQVGEAPKITPPDVGFVRLQSPLTVGDQQVTEIEVMELTGESEERLAKASTSDDQMRFYNTLLEEGVPEKIGGKPSSEILPKMIVGDREALLLAIREATFGPTMEIPVFCSSCREAFLAEVNVSDVPTRDLTSDIVFEVPLRKGGKARVRLPNGADQTAYLQVEDMTLAERNSIILSRCVQTITSNGDEVLVAAFPSLVRNLGVVDRQSILSEIDKRQPGPRYNEVVVKHDECENEVEVPIGMMSLFPGL